MTRAKRTHSPLESPKASPGIAATPGVDFDADLHALRALARRLADAGRDYGTVFAFAPNSGLQDGRDADGDGRTGTPGDAQGYGEFAGQGGMALLSVLPVDIAASRDFSGYLWQDLPGALLTGDTPPEGASAVQRLSSVGHWDLSLDLPDGREMRLLAWHASPPVFDGPEDRNGRRNHDEAAFWLSYLDGRLAQAPGDAPFVLLGDANLDPDDGDGRPEALRRLLAHPRLLDPMPKSVGGPVTCASTTSCRPGTGGSPHRACTGQPVARPPRSPRGPPVTGLSGSTSSCLDGGRNRARPRVRPRRRRASAQRVSRPGATGPRALREHGKTAEEAE